VLVLDVPVRVSLVRAAPRDVRCRRRTIISLRGRRKATGRSTEAASSDGGSAAPVLRGTAFPHANGAFDHFEFFCDSDVVALVGDHVDKSTASALLGPIHQLFQLLLAGFPDPSLLGKLLAVMELISARIGQERHRIFECGCAIRMGGPFSGKNKTGPVRP
jgi:hypothetical protein